MRRSMTPAERMHEKELREECRERNRQLKSRVWVVYRGELRRAKDLPQGFERPGKRLTRQGSPLGMNCFLFNARSLSNKLHHLHLFLATYKPELLLITESWLSSKILKSEITANFPYKVFRADRSSRRGGDVCCLARDCINLTEIALPPSLKSDVLILDGFNSQCSMKFRIILLYRPPNSSADDEALIDCLFDLCLSNTH